MPGPQTNRPLFTAAFEQIDMHQAWGAGDGGLPTKLGSSVGGDAQTLAPGHGDWRQRKCQSGSSGDSESLACPGQGARGHQPKAVMDGPDDSPTFDELISPQHQAGGTATIQVQGIAQSQLLQG